VAPNLAFYLFKAGIQRKTVHGVTKNSSEEFNHEPKARDLAAEVEDQVCNRPCRATGCEYIIDDQNLGHE